MIEELYEEMTEIILFEDLKIEFDQQGLLKTEFTKKIKRLFFSEESV